MPKILNCRGPVVKNDIKWIYDYLEYDAFCPNDVSKVIEEAKKENDTVILRINSPGGHVDAGAEMYEEIKSSDIFVEARVVGNCCSAATYLTCAARESTMSPLGQFMIHKCSVGGASGNADDFEVILQSLNETDKSIAFAYSLKTGKKEDEMLKLMSKTTSMSPQIALENGFIDKILFVDNTIENNVIGNIKVQSFINSDSFLIPEDIINQMQNNKNVLTNKQKDINDLKSNMALTKLNFLKLGGEEK